MRIATGRLVVLLALPVLTVALCAQVPEGAPVQHHGFMRPDAASRALARERFSHLPVASFASPTARAQPRGSTTLLADVATQGAVRNQGSNGDCWVWSSTAMTEVALKGTYGITDRLSTQYADSLMSANSWANGGWFFDYATYLNQGGILVPWSNGNAAYVNGSVNGYVTASLIPTAQIQLTPAYTHAVLTPSQLSTQGVGQANAISNIKAALDAGRAVAFDFFTNFTGTGGFDDWWANNDESVLWPEPIAGTDGQTYDTTTWGGHEVAIVGYDDTDPVAANHYWLVLNSWGVPSNRPNGCFRLPMVMNYDSTFIDAGHPSQTYSFGTLALSIDHPAPAAPTVAATPATVLAPMDQPFTLQGAVTGYPPFTYQWFNGTTAITGATSAWYTDGVPAATDSGVYTLVVTGTAGGPVTSGAAQVLVQPLEQLLTNPGFETAPATSGGPIPGWTFSSTGQPTGYESPYRSSANAHEGTGYLFLGNTPDSSSTLAPASGTVTQTVTLPAAGTATLGLWIHMVTNETATSDIDTLDVQVQAASGTVTLKHYTNQDTKHLLWTRDTFSLSAYMGQTIQLAFVWACPTTQQTLWRIDDVDLTVASAVAAAPAVAAFSPSAALPGTVVTLTGSGFQGAAAVTFNGVLQSAFSVDSDTQITVTVPASATTGPIAVLNSLGTGTSPSSFTVKTLNFDGTGIDVGCMADLAAAFGSTTGSAHWFAPCDLNGDGAVDANDVILFLANF